LEDDEVRPLVDYWRDVVDVDPPAHQRERHHGTGTRVRPSSWIGLVWREGKAV